MKADSMIDGPARQRIRKWEKNRDGRQTIRLTSPDHEALKNFETFCEDLAFLAPSLRIKPGEQGNPSSEERDLPGLIVRKNITYSALPLEKELEPFLKGLDLIHSQKPEPESHILKALEQIQAPCDLTLYIALQCPHCPGMVNTLLPLAVFCEKIRLTIIDGSLFPEAAQKDRVMSAPCLILEDEFRWTGAVTAEEIITMMIEKDPAKLSPESLKNIIEEGNAQWITDKMIETRTLFPGFIELLLHGTWSVRLGAMVIVESLGEEHPGLAKKICPRLIREFPGREIPVQGDILYALGQAGDKETLEWLAATLNTLDHPDLKEACEDALADMDSRLGSWE
ncbi:thioredoxin family protein [Desulfospira joergensenii]|uniref:thioredoxin family protein n=1 Tax=Desulfospira joergensenii TaxID=53329 RepID=UPI0003B6F9D1|nr:thioredoxin family protein [Desulfospira joergensenii]